MISEEDVKFYKLNEKSFMSVMTTDALKGSIVQRDQLLK
jgi:hypothetical protein